MTRYTLAGFSMLGLTFIAAAGVLLTHQADTEAHCQVPCGIYDDAARIKHLKEDAATIAKAIASINELADKRDAQAFNQASRWVSTKEAHASDIIEIVSEYFLAQKVKPVAPGAEGYDAYLKTLADHHAVIVAAMKTKQSVDHASVEALTEAIDKLATHY